MFETITKIFIAYEIYQKNTDHLAQRQNQGMINMAPLQNRTERKSKIRKALLYYVLQYSLTGLRLLDLVDSSN